MTKLGQLAPGIDRKMGNIGTVSESNPVTAHGIFNIIMLVFANLREKFVN